MPKKKERTIAQRKHIAIAAILLFLAFTVLICWQVGPPMMKLASDPESFRQWLSQRKAGGLMVYGFMVFFQVIFAVIPGEPLEIAGGYAFGAFWGTLVCLAAATLGSLLVFALVRRFGRGLVELFFSAEKLHSIRFLQESPKRTVLFLIIYMIPGTPKDLLSYYAGLTDIKFPLFLLVSSLGRLPSLVSSTIGGDALGTRSYVFAVVVFLITFCLSLLGLFLYQKICQRHNKAKKKTSQE